MDVSAALCRLGVKQLRGKQQDAIDAVLQGRDVLFVFPTGTGKTLVYEVAALCSAGATVVVSPLVGLLQEQALKAARRGVGVIQAFDGNLTGSPCSNSDVKLVYTTPEQARSGSAVHTYLLEQNIIVCRLVVDEAHLVHDWDTFR